MSFTPASAYDYDALLRCGKGELFDSGGPRLPAPPFLMFDAISHIASEGGAFGRGQVLAELKVKEDLWFFACHFRDDPVMPGCLGLDALWQMLGFFLGWSGNLGYGRALGVGRVRFGGMIMPNTKKVEYQLDIRRLIQRRLIMGIGNGRVLADGREIYAAEDLRVGLFSPETLAAGL